jgi:hypothetical protein
VSSASRVGIGIVFLAMAALVLGLGFVYLRVAFRRQWTVAERRILIASTLAYRVVLAGLIAYLKSFA